ncbi:MAG: PilT/PilU family type 4a pilus ATPase [Nostocaceae cyanobacterium]|nr:PilT/PilU family type 4a pilus ATPase [Nostocaceae cyanobacterium]
MDEKTTSRFQSPQVSHLRPPLPNESLTKPLMLQNKIISIQQMLGDAHTQQASDIHIRVGEVPRFRVRGQMLAYHLGEMVTPQIFEAYLKEILTPSQRQKFAQSKELDTAIFYPGFLRCRVNCFETLTGGAMVLRLITLNVPSIDSLGLPCVLKQIVSRNQGLILVTGPTGSGKSTTLAAMINYLNHTTQKHIVTIEDPIEYVHSSQQCLISQREVGLHTHEFNQALRSVLREDPDVILIGEMRDRLSLETALKAAQTGHLVLGTLHTKNAISTIHRLLNIYNPDEQAGMRVQILDSLVAVISQLLIPTTDGRRTAAMEVLINTPAMQDYLLKGEETEAFQLMEENSNEGMQIMNQALCQLMLSGIISIEDAVNASPDVGDLRRRTRNDGLDPSQSTARDFDANYNYYPR